MNPIQRGLQQGADQWATLPTKRRAAIVGIAAAGVALFVGILTMATHESYVPLMTNLSAEDAAEIVANLNEKRVPYHLSAGGTAILVPEDQVHDVRLQLAGAGLPKGGNVGFEIFDQPSFGVSRFAEQLNYRRALEGELRRTVRQIDVVRDARVHIVLPENRLFAETQQAASASVTLHLHPGRRLSAGQVQAILHLVSSSVPGLQPDRIAIVDSAGNVLAKGGGNEADLDRVFERQSVIERGLEERVQQLLVPLVGEGRVLVRVAATLDYSRNEKTSETFDPQTVVRSEQITEEKRGQNAASPGGVPGTRSNLTGVGTKNATSNTNASNSDRRLETRNYEVTKVVSHEVGHAGKVARLSVAVLLDNASVGPDGKRVVVERSADELARITELTRRAIGFDVDREDQVVIQSMPFEREVASQDVVELPPKWLSYIERYWLHAMATLVCLCLCVVLLRRRAVTLQASEMIESPMSVRELERRMDYRGPQQTATQQQQQAQPGALEGAAMGGLPPAASAGALPPARIEPKKAAAVLKTWLSEA